MSNNLVQDLRDFHDKFGLDKPANPKMLDIDTLAFRIKFLQEELNEVLEAAADNDTAQVAAELCDLVYVTIGMADMMGVDFQKHWDVIQEANMKKERCTDASKSKRGSTLDIIKPEGWVKPDHQVVLDSYSLGA